MNNLPSTSNPFVLPDWLSGTKTSETPKARVPANPVKALRETQFEIMFEHFIDQVAIGVSLKKALELDWRDPNYAQFLKWVFKDPGRTARYHEAQKISAEVLADEMMSIAKGEGEELREVQRDKLIVDTIRYSLGVRDRKRFGDTKQLEVTGSISVTAALAEANNRVIEATYTREDDNE